MGRAKPLTGAAAKARLDRSIAAWNDGATLKEIAEREGVHRNTIQSMFARHGFNTKVSRVCALVECSVEFTTSLRTQKYCSPSHSKRGDQRSQTGRTATYMPCRLPGCNKRVITMEETTSNRFCSVVHTRRYHSRLSVDYYNKLINKTECSACGWWGPGLQQHHIKPKAHGGSDHPSNLCWLCPNCHTLVHSGLGTINHKREFDDLREIRRAEAISRASDWNQQ